MSTENEKRDLELKAAACVFGAARAELLAAGKRWEAADPVTWRARLMGELPSSTVGPADYEAAVTAYIAASNALHEVAAATPVAVNVIPQEAAHAE